MVATTKDRVQISGTSIRNAFPHLLSSSDSGPKCLISRLLGQEFTMFGAVNLRWDANDGRVTSFLYKADMIKPIMRILGSLHDVSLLFHGALVTADCNIAVEGNPNYELLLTG